MHVLTVNVETDINSSYAVPIRPRFIRNTEIGHGRDKIILVSLGMRHIPLFLNCLIITNISVESVFAVCLNNYVFS